MKQFSLTAFKKLKILTSGLEVGIPVHIMTSISKQNYNIKNFNKQTILNYILTFTTYKLDRYSDSQEYNSQEYTKTFNQHLYNLEPQIKQSKIDLYKSIKENDKMIELSLFIAFTYIIISTIHDNQSYYLPLLVSTFNYKDLKKKYAFFKPIYLSTIWALTTSILPFLAYIDFNYIMHHNSFLPLFMNIFATTNIADLSDYEEDTKNNVKTLPISIGKNNTVNLIRISALISIVSFCISDIFELNVLNTIFITSNIYPLLYNITLT